MKSLFYLFCGALLLTACQNKTPGNKQDSVIAPDIAAGTLVAADSMPLKNDLNHFYFSVKVIANKNTAGYGDYDVEASVGPNIAQGQFTMPKGGKDLKPLIRQNTEGSTYTIGFRTSGDTTFYPYYEVSAVTGGQVSMQYLKGYSFE
jgi:hypothetical protein